MEDQAIVPDITEAPVEQQPAADQVIQPTKTVGTFWERLDEVFKMNLQSQQMRERVEELIETFGESVNVRQQNHPSFLFQPDRIALTSSDDVARVNAQPGTLAIDISGVSPIKNGAYNEQFFSNFRIRLDKGLLNVKSIQLLSCVVPNIVPNIPNYSLGFFYYRLRALQFCQLPNWNANTPYLQYDYVFYPRTGFGYQSLVNGNNNFPPDQNPTKWRQILNYDNNYGYSIPEIVFNPVDNFFYRLNYPGVVVGHPPPDPTYWVKLGSYDNTILYNKGDIVLSTIDNNYYVCIGFNIIAQEPSTSSNFTQLTDDDSAPNYFDLTPDFLNVIYLQPTNGYCVDNFTVADQQTINRRFTDYNDLLTSLNLCAATPENCAGAAGPNQITFSLFESNDQTSIYFQMTPTQPPLTYNYYYLTPGYADPNIATFVANLPTNNNNALYAPIFKQNFVAEYTLNTRLGFTWNGVFVSPYLINPYTSYMNSCGAATYWFMRPQWLNAANPTLALQRTLTANTSADLVYTSCIRLYADFVFGSTQDSQGNGGLLSLVPVNASNNGVGFYQNNFSNPLLKVPKLITEIGISLTDDQGLPYYLPNSATVLLELAVTYY